MQVWDPNIYKQCSSSILWHCFVSCTRHHNDNICQIVLTPDCSSVWINFPHNHPDVNPDLTRETHQVSFEAKRLKKG